MSVSFLQKQLKTEHTIKSNLKRELTDVKVTTQAIIDVENRENHTPQLKSKNNKDNTFSDDLCLTFMELQGRGNVAASNCSKVVNIVYRYLYGKEIPLEDLPCHQTALNMCSESLFFPNSCCGRDKEQ